MSSYRFCRTDDIGLLVSALNRCWAPHAPDEPPMTEAAFKRTIRDLQVWCSSCMVAFSGADPIAVLIGAKRASGTLIHKVAVHPDHTRRGHARHLLTSLSSKLAILGPPAIVAEVSASAAAACALFTACGYEQAATLTDYVVPLEGMQAPGTVEGRWAMPVTVDDLAANGLLDDRPFQVCWERSVETLTARRAELAGLAIASDEHIEAYLLHGPDGELLSLRWFVEDGGARAGQLLSLLSQRVTGRLRWPKVHAAEIPSDLLHAFGFRPAGVHVRYLTRAQHA